MLKNSAVLLSVIPNLPIAPWPAIAPRWRAILVGFDARVETHSNPECDERGKGDGGEEAPRELVVAGSDAAEILEPAEGSFDARATLVSGLVVQIAALRFDRPGITACAPSDFRRLRRALASCESAANNDPH